MSFERLDAWRGLARKAKEEAECELQRVLNVEYALSVTDSQSKIVLLKLVYQLQRMNSDGADAKRIWTMEEQLTACARKFNVTLKELQDLLGENEYLKND